MIRLKNISKSYGKSFNISKLNLHIEKGKLTSLLGPNGAGKTTIIRMITGLSSYNEGEILYDNEIFNRDSNHLKKKIGVVNQHINLDKELSVYENLIFAGKLYGLKGNVLKERVTHQLAQFNLEIHKDKLVKKLSGGMKRKLMIARALIHFPETIFLDEPTVGIDLVSRKQIWNEFIRLKNEGKTIILTTHHIEEAEYLSDKVILLNDGIIYSKDTPTNLINDLGKYTIEWFEGEVNHKFFTTLEKANIYSNKLNVVYSIRKTTLEDVFYQFTKKKVN
ncbi:ABC transporter ATP-binding protein [Helicovermis profundi]|uniref:ATP-binding cassette domain-containing protein n=1 Tax=Helicovermis profundi TaxID=3065157 RepID=A0AAU9EJZ7_9FIRM|nr:ATP-binding cassette domain-containing protein [Clostridia bacterium S502]